MTILKVARLGHPILRQVAQALDPANLPSAAIQTLIDDMIETMHDYEGAGLAAPQVHHSLRVLVMEVEKNPRYPDFPAIPLTVLVNPEIEVLDQETISVMEGCLSVPGLRGLVKRPANIRLRALDRAGNRVDQVFNGFAAAVIQHECDHLDGRVFLDRVDDHKSLAFLDELRRFGPLV